MRGVFVWEDVVHKDAGHRPVAVICSLSLQEELRRAGSNAAQHGVQRTLTQAASGMVQEGDLESDIARQVSLALHQGLRSVHSCKVASMQFCVPCNMTAMSCKAYHVVQLAWQAQHSTA